jgi:hypothetical protein
MASLIKSQPGSQRFRPPRPPRLIRDRPTWVRLLIAYGGVVVSTSLLAISLPDVGQKPILSTGLLALGVATVLLWSVLIADLFFSGEYGSAQVATVGWIGVAAGFFISILAGRNVLANALALAALFGLGGWAIAKVMIRTRVAILPPPPGAAPPTDPGDWSTSSLRASS